ncbi:MAG: hypothetical protein QXY49_04710 [Thermofilaceae archaeon]
MRNFTLSDFREREILRKLAHIILSLLMIIPLSPKYSLPITGFGTFDNALTTYTAALVTVLFVTSLQVKKPELREAMLRLSREARKSVLQHLREVIPNQELVEGVEQALDRAESGFLSIIESIERDYERRYGYIAAVCGLTGVTASYIFFGREATLRGILALAVVDPVASITTLYSPVQGRILKHNVFSPFASFLVYFLILIIMGESIITALILGLASSTVELLSLEDNLTLPLGAASLYILCVKIGL